MADVGAMFDNIGVPRGSQTRRDLVLDLVHHGAGERALKRVSAWMVSGHRLTDVPDAELHVVAALRTTFGAIARDLEREAMLPSEQRASPGDLVRQGTAHAESFAAHTTKLRQEFVAPQANPSLVVKREPKTRRQFG